MCVSVHATEHFVDSQAAEGGDGSKEHPYKTIAEALKSIIAGDTLTIKGGTYYESKLTLGAVAEADVPIVIQGAAGERVIISGFTPIVDWQADKDGIFKARTEVRVNDLFVDYVPQQCGFWPEDGTRRYLVNADKEAFTFADRDELPTAIADVIAKNPASVVAVMFSTTANTFMDTQVTALNAATKTFTGSKGGWPTYLTKETDRYTLMNHPSFIKKPGQWAWVGDSEGTGGTIYFLPNNSDDLKKTQYRNPAHQPLMHISRYGHTPSYITVRNIEFTGSGNLGLQVSGSADITIDSCIFHSNFGNGFFARNSKNITFKNNVVLFNGNGASYASTEGGLVEGNEIAWNLVDGLVIAGNVSGREGGEPESRDITVRRNFLRSHFLQAHPDNMQTYRGVHGLTIEENFFLLGGQQLMTEQTYGVTFKNNVMAGSGAASIIAGHNSSDGWEISGNTLGWSHYAIFNLTGENYKITNNILWGGSANHIETFTWNYNFYVPVGEKFVVARVTKPKWTNFATLAEATAATGQDADSLMGDPKFKNAPATFSVLGGGDDDTPDFLTIPKGSDSEFQTGDKIEINGDGKLRTVTAIENGKVRFTPALPTLPFRGAYTFNWKQADSTTFDLTIAADSPAKEKATNGQPFGSQLDIVAMQKGDLLGSGKRTIPVLAEDILAAFPDPNNIVVPPYGR